MNLSKSLELREIEESKFIISEIKLELQVLRDYANLLESAFLTNKLNSIYNKL